MLVFFLFWICGISYVGASHFVVTAPNVLRFDHKETILVSVFGETQFKVKTWLQIDDRKFSIETVTVQNEGNPKPSSILVTEDDLFAKEDDEQENEDIPKFVTLYAETSLGTYSRKIPLSYDTGYILVQTSKPLYHPKDKVNVRALAMTESLRFAQGWNISMHLISPSGITFGRYVKTKSKDRFFEESMTIPPQAELGLWTAKAYFKGQYKTQGKAYFKVQEYVLPTFGVTVDVDKKVILPDTEKVKITVTAKYVYNKPVKGKAVLKISCLDDDKNLISLEDQPHITLDNSGKGEYTVDVEDIIETAGGFPDGQRLHISARAIEQVTLNEEMGTYANTLFSRNRFKLDFEKSKKIYHPGFSYYLRVTVSLANGDFPGVQTLKVVSKVNNNVKEEKTKESDRKGRTLVVFATSNEENAPLVFEVSINGEPASVFTVHPYMSKHQIQIDHFIKNNKRMLDITTNIQKDDNASGIICLMLSRGKYIHHEYFESANDLEREISENIQDNIAPAARLVGFYINMTNGNVIADSSSMSLTPKCHGQKLTLIPDNAQEVPGAVSMLDIRGVPGMYVGLNVMDKALLLLDDDHVLRKSKTKVFIEGVRGLCTGADPGKTHLIATFDLQPSDAQTVRIPILPLEARDSFNIRVTALGQLKGQGLSDAVEKKLLVVNEGIEERETIQVCLDPLNTDDDNPKCLKNVRVKSRVEEDHQITEVNLTLPDRALIETGSAFAYLSSNAMDEPVREMISGIGNMLRKPYGCGEQTMILLGPTVYVKMYWEQTNQMNPDRERQANIWIREGVTRELSFRQRDGASYAAWRDHPPSTWLTAFVAKVFCQAERIVDDAVTPADDIVPTIKWLEKMVKEPEGNFYDPNPVYHRSMMGQVKENDPSLTAFVLITLSECEHRSENTDRVRLRAMQYLERLPTTGAYEENPYLLAITTYALSMAKSRKQRRFMKMLLVLDNTYRIGGRRRDKDHHRNQHGRFWGNPGGHPANAESVETTAYALLAMLKQHRIREAANVVKWLIDQRNAEGAFRTTQDTVIGLQALSEYTAATYTTDVDLYVKLSSEGWEGSSLRLSKENIDLQEIVKGIPVSREKTTLVVTTKGRGTGRLVIDYRYNRKATEHEKCSFEISDIEIEELNHLDIDIGNQDFNRDCDVCGKCRGDNGANNDNVIFDDPDVNEIPEIQAHIAKRAAGNEDKPPKKICIRFSVGSLGTNDHGMSIIDIGLETGMTVVKSDLDKLKTDGVIDSYEMPTQKKGFVILYIDKIVKEPVKIIFRLKDNFEGDSSSRQPAAIKVYDYYHPEKECTKFYGTGVQTGSPVEFECQGDGKTNKKTCTCLQNVCPDPEESDKIIKKGKAREKPVQQLVELVCDNQRANFAARVKVLRVHFDVDKGTQTLHVEVKKSLHKGRDDLSNGDELELEMRIFCKLEIIEGQEYYLITKDGVGEGPVKYHLSGTSLMVEYLTEDERKIFRRSDRGYLQQIMNVFERKIAGGCPG